MLEVSIKIRSKSYLAKYFNGKYGNAVVINSSKNPGKIIIGIMHMGDKLISRHFGDDVIEIKIPSWCFKNYKIKGFTDVQGGEILAWLHNELMDSMFTYIDSRISIREELVQQFPKGVAKRSIVKERNINRLSIDKAIQDFCEIYSITNEDLNFESVIKAYYRERQSGKRLFNGVVKEYSRSLSDSTLNEIQDAKHNQKAS